jgi:hypothetical protein
MASSSNQEAFESRKAKPSYLFDASVNLNSLPCPHTEVKAEWGCLNSA